MSDRGITKTGQKVNEKDAGDVSRFLNRILGLSVARQQLVSCVRSIGVIYGEYHMLFFSGMLHHCWQSKLPVCLFALL